MNKHELKWATHPRIYEINTWPWLNKLSEVYGHKITLENVPVDIIDKKLGNFDAIWCMGVWERSPKGKEVAINHEGLQKEFKKALRYFNTEDVVGSPYAVYYYHVDSKLGGNEALKSFRNDLSNRGLKLILDYVPNHVAVDHLWTLEKSDTFINGTLDDLMSKPYEYFSIGRRVFAHGRDPNFNPWTDTVQINAFSKDARNKTINTLLSVAELCDGVRCDMAMLLVNKVFSKTWGNKAGSIPETEFWEEVIPSVRRKFPNFKFIAEVYWDMEWDLQKQGFDYTYDKRLYERLLNDRVPSIKKHLQAGWDYQSKLLRYIENHDEERVINVLGKDASKAASIIIMTLPGARLIHEGQMEGNEIKLPIQLGRTPEEEIKNEISEFYLNLMQIIPGREINDAKWDLCEVEPVKGSDHSYDNILAYTWHLEDYRKLIVVNYGLKQAKAHIRIKDIKFENYRWKFEDLLNKKEYIYNGIDLSENGLYVELKPWKAHLFTMSRIL